MKFYYSASTMGYDGKGYCWHRFFNFPKFDIVTKTITLNTIIGTPFMIFHLGKSIWNKVGLHNPGIKTWLKKYYNENLILSIAGELNDLEKIIDIIYEFKLRGLELNYSCPNYKKIKFNDLHKIPKNLKYLDCDKFLKLNYEQNPFRYDLDQFNEIRLNSIPTAYGGLSGKLAQKFNWSYIEKFNSKGLNISGCSIVEFNDIIRLRNIGCTSIGLGSVLLINPLLVSYLKDYI